MTTITTRPHTFCYSDTTDFGGLLAVEARDEHGTTFSFYFDPSGDKQALDRIDSLIETAAALRDHWRRKVEAEAAEMAAEDEAERAKYERDMQDEAFARHNAA